MQRSSTRCGGSSRAGRKSQRRAGRVMMPGPMADQPQQAQLIDGNAIAANVRAEVGAGIAKLKAMGKPVHLVAMLVGGTPAAELYASRQAEGCRAIGIDYTLLSLPEDISNRDLRMEVRRLNEDASVTGVMIHMPLPHHIDAPRLLYEIDVVKDVEGVSPANIGYVL